MNYLRDLQVYARNLLRVNLGFAVTVAPRRARLRMLLLPCSEADLSVSAGYTSPAVAFVGFLP